MQFRTVVFWVMIVVMSSSRFAAAVEDDPLVIDAVPLAVSAEDAAETRPGWGHRILWYVPNRFLDLFDMVRARLRVGPGLAANIRVTEQANLYGGEYHTVYVGLPGPRRRKMPRSPIGREEEKGILMMGVDATDTMKYEPGYSSTELDVGLQVLLIGAEVGFDPVEMGDFLAGFIFLDPVGDDL